MKIKNIIVGILTLGILNVVSGCEDFWINLLTWGCLKMMSIKIMLL